MHVIIALCIISGIYGKIQGIVSDKDTRDPISNANVLLVNTEIGASTDDDGMFYLLFVPPGVYALEVSYIGFQTQRIEGIVVEVDRIIRLSIELQSTPIEMMPITVTSELPVVQKDYVGTTYIIKPTEFSFMQVDYTSDLIAFQPSVARTESTLHVRGGRATEVNYMIDNVSIIDPQTGDPAIALSKGVIDRVVFLPGGFDAEYGRAMSGVINLITERPANNFKAKLYGKSEEFMPYYYDFGYRNAQASIHLPASRKVKGLISLDVMHTDDWDPRLYIQPHKQRDDYSVYGKWVYQPSGMLNIGISGVMSRIQFDRYAPAKWRWLYRDYRSDYRRGDLQVININLLPDSKKLISLILSRLYTKRIYGVRELGSYGIFEDFKFRPHTTLQPFGYDQRNPWGVWSSQWFTQGTYGTHNEKSSSVFKSTLHSVIQLDKYHELITGAEYIYQDFYNFTFLVSNKDTADPIADEYQYQPIEYSFYFQDNIDFRGLYAKIGCRYDYFSTDISGIQPKRIISPRIGVSFLLTKKFLFRANIGQYAQPPLYDYIYGWYKLLQQYPHLELMFVGNPDLGPEKTTSYEIGLQGEIKKNILLTINSFYKDINDLVGTRYVPHLPNSYNQYFNIEFANVKGVESILEYSTSNISMKLSYTLSWARGTSSYAEDIYYRYYANDPDPDTTFVPPAEQYPLSFDQRHRIFLQGQISLPFKTKASLLCYFGNGLSYEEPGPEGNLKERQIYFFSFQKQIDCMFTKSFKVGTFELNGRVEIINLLDIRNQIADHHTFISLETINRSDFNEYISIRSAYYGPPADVNHDGLITPSEEYNAYYALVQETDDWVNAYSDPRRLRIGLMITFN